MNNPYWLICYWGREGKGKGIGYRSLWKFSEVIDIHPCVYIKIKNLEKIDKCEYVLTFIHKMTDEEIDLLQKNDTGMEFSPKEFYVCVLEGWE